MQEKTELSSRLNEPLANGAVIHIVPRLAGAKSGGVFQAVLGAALIGYGNLDARNQYRFQ
ncbi:tail component of prophage CP-933K [Escherichia coli]|uniref:Tail component of prophage CP-933K n=1 Tax=Escherichia coli TaxID=562 RepID=A0A3S4K5W3_ECOLX|nr:tail component of prophage CP-933K [Escherichia coli]